MRLQKRVTDVVVCGEDGCTTPVKWTFTRYQEFCTVHREQRKRAQYQARQAAQVVRHAAERGYVPCPRCGTHYPPIRTWVPVRPCPDCRKEIHREKAVIHFRERAPEARHASELRWRRANADKVRHRNYARRAAVTGAEAEYIELGSVAVRDNFYCGICGNPVDMTLVWPHPDSPTLDHIVPVSHGGPHIYANVRLAHSTCNSARSNRGTY